MKQKTLFVLMAAVFGMAACSPEQSKEQAASSASAASVTAAPAGKLHGTDMSQEDIGGDFTLTDGKGQPFSLSSLKGKPVILAFGFTHCPAVCPTELLSYKEAVQQLGERAKDVAVVFVSVDPERDTPELIGKYVEQFNPDFIGLTATGDQQLAVVKQQYRIVSAKTEQKSDKVYNVDHSAGAYLLDKEGNVAAFEPYGSTSDQIAHDLKVMLDR